MRERSGAIRASPLARQLWVVSGEFLGGHAEEEQVMVLAAGVDHAPRGPLACKAQPLMRAMPAGSSPWTAALVDFQPLQQSRLGAVLVTLASYRAISPRFRG